jgi:phage portal protein BeeE
MPRIIAFLKAVRRYLRNAENSGATFVIEPGAKWQPINLTAIDTRFIESRNFDIREIAQRFK